MSRWWRQALGWRYTGLLLLVVLTLVLHFSIIMQPGELVFDEQHYVKDARVIISQHATERTEHPPVAKLLIAANMFIFGDNPIGWRLFPIILGAVCIVLFYFICMRLGMSEEASLLATFLFSLENLSFVQASIAMLDIYMLTFTLASFLLYLNRRYLSAGVSIGLSALSKLYGALAAPAIFLHWLFTRKTRVEYVLITMAASALSFLALMPVFDFAIWRRWLEPLSQIKNMLALSASLTFATTKNDVLSRPWEWMLRPDMMYYWYDPHYIGAISFTIWALIIPAVLYMLYHAIRHHDNASIFGLSWFTATYLVWIPISIVTDRNSFIFYFYPTVGAICIGIGLGLSRLMDVWRNRPRTKTGTTAISMVVTYLLCHVAVFFILSPVFSKWVRLFHVY